MLQGHGAGFQVNLRDPHWKASSACSCRQRPKRLPVAINGEHIQPVPRQPQSVSTATTRHIKSATIRR
jgi:hypothetical protein